MNQLSKQMVNEVDRAILEDLTDDSEIDGAEEAEEVRKERLDREFTEELLQRIYQDVEKWFAENQGFTMQDGEIFNVTLHFPITIPPVPATKVGWWGRLCGRHPQPERRGSRQIRR